VKALIQRVSKASVSVKGEVVGKINDGLLILAGVAENDTEKDLDWISEKCVNLRIFEDDQGKMNRSLLDVGGEILVISQFTLLGDARKGRRPSFVKAASPEKGEDFYNRFVDKLKSFSVVVETGIFGAMMNVELVNRGPVTLMVDSKE
jgi:D-tyrosyl-tRNA(Tyr) deacylase